MTLVKERLLNSLLCFQFAILLPSHSLALVREPKHVFRSGEVQLCTIQESELKGLKWCMAFRSGWVGPESSPCILKSATLVYLQVFLAYYVHLEHTTRFIVMLSMSTSVWDSKHSHNTDQSQYFATHLVNFQNKILLVNTTSYFTELHKWNDVMCRVRPEINRSAVFRGHYCLWFCN